jgi:hypothetical protein
MHASNIITLASSLCFFSFSLAPARTQQAVVRVDGRPNNPGRALPCRARIGMHAGELKVDPGSDPSKPGRLVRPAGVDSYVPLFSFLCMHANRVYVLLIN